jgi:hypothetical protein
MLLSGCLQSVEISNGADGATTHPGDGALPAGLDATAPLPGLDASIPLPGLDASSPQPGPDASPQPVSDASAPPLFDAGHLAPDASVAGCASDLDCRLGQICLSDCNKMKGCTDGCWDSTQCPVGDVCQNVVTNCGETYGSCVASPSCTDDSVCPIGSTCDFAGIGGVRECVPGCHTAANCAKGDTCLLPACPMCANCPCVGTCQPPVVTCTKDSCPVGQVCGTTKTECSQHCVAGCTDSTQCRPDQECQMPGCASACGCDVGFCQQLSTCSGDSECPVGDVCGVSPTDCSVMQCKPGCRDISQCQAGQTCNIELCNSCWCDGTGKCGSCQADTDCGVGVGQICMDCGNGNECVSGCRASSDCGSGKLCEMVMCFGFCCPPICATAPATCTQDYECGGIDEVCEYTDHTACSGDKTCQLGCHQDGQCGTGTCMPTNCGQCCPGACSK